jgi:hypothetical protein
MRDVDDGAPFWPNDQKPPMTKPFSRPKTYVLEMTVIGVAHNTGPDAIVAAVREGLSPDEFKCLIKGQAGHA